MASRFSFEDMGMLAEPEVPSYMYNTPSLQPETISGIGSSFAQPQFFVPSWIKPQGGDVRGKNPYQNIALTPGTTYRLIDFTGRNDNTVLAQGSTPEDLARIQDIVNTQLVPQGRKADWRLEQITPEGQSVLLGGDYYNKPGSAVIGDIAKIAAPIALQFIPGLGTALGASLGLSGIGATAVGTGLTAALGRAGAGIVTGENLGQALKSGLTTGAISGLTAGALQGLGVTPGATPTSGGANAGALAKGGLQGFSAFDPSSLYTADLGLGQLAGIGGSLGSAASAIPQAIGNEILVQGARGAAGSIAPSILGSAAGAASSLASSPATNAAQQATETVDAEQTVTGKKIPPAKIPDPTLIDFSGAPFYVPQTVIPPFSPPPTVTAKKPLTAAEIARLGLGGFTALQGLANLFGGSGGSGSPGIGGGFNETVSFQPLNRTRNVATFDPFTYGQSGGEFRFFGNERPVFQVGIGGPALPAPEPEQEPVRAKRGGPIRGIGGGQEDKIPAMLSDGEYVFSAQDVADLGDGSNDEGARRLDEMRKLIRKQAGRKNTKTIAKPQKSVSSLLRAAR